MLQGITKKETAIDRGSRHKLHRRPHQDKA